MKAAAHAAGRSFLVASDCTWGSDLFADNLLLHVSCCGGSFLLQYLDSREPAKWVASCHLCNLHACCNVQGPRAAKQTDVFHSVPMCRYITPDECSFVQAAQVGPARLTVPFGLLYHTLLEGLPLTG